MVFIGTSTSASKPKPVGLCMHSVLYASSHILYIYGHSNKWFVKTIVLLAHHLASSNGNVGKTIVVYSVLVNVDALMGIWATRIRQKSQAFSGDGVPPRFRLIIDCVADISQNSGKPPFRLMSSTLKDFAGS